MGKPTHSGKILSGENAFVVLEVGLEPTRPLLGKGF